MGHKNDQWRELVIREYRSENYHLSLRVHRWRAQAITHVISDLSSGGFTKHPLCSYPPNSLLYPRLVLLAAKAESFGKVQWTTERQSKGTSSAGSPVGSDGESLSHSKKP